MNDKNLINKKIIRAVCIVVFVLFAISLAPTILIGFFSHPIFDDYSYGLELHRAGQNGFNPVDIICAIYKSVSFYFNHWQGTYSALFLFSIQPGAFFDLYFLTPIVLVGALTLANIVFFNTVLEKMIGEKTLIPVMVSIIVSGFQIQFIPHIKESFFWYNGGIYYLFFFSLMLIQISFLIKLIYSKKVLILVLAIVNAFFVAGGNYSTALVCALIAFEFMFFAILLKKDFRPYLLIGAIGVIGLMISIFAPGNQFRGAHLEGMGALQAVGMSLLYAGKSILQWMGISQIGLLLLLIGIMFPVFVKYEGFEFRFPILLTVLCFLTYAALSTPAYYAMAIPGAERQINMYYCASYYALIIPSIYIEGRIVSKLRNKIKSVQKKKTFKTLYFAALILSVAIIFAGVASNARNLTSVVNYLDLKSGRAQRYDSEYERFEKDIASSENGICYTSDINEWPESFYRLGITDENNWINKDMAEYFGIKMIVVK